MDSSFGSRLKAQRESQQVTLETIAGRTKIRLVLLDALEHDDLSHWPPGLFRRSYLRSYAAAIGLDPESTVREFLALYPDAIEEPEPTAAASADAERARQRPPMRLQYLIASAMGVFSPRKRQQDTETAPAGSTLNAAREPEHEERHGGFDEELETACADDFVEAETPVQFDLPAMAQLCTRIVEANSAGELARLLEEAARILHVIGIIVWPWDQARGVLWPSLSYGYSRQTLARLPTLTRDADNPIGAAFRSASRQVIHGGGAATSAVVVPLTTPRGCVGVLALECSSGLEQEPALQALATILAAQLSVLVSAEPRARTAIA